MSGQPQLSANSKCNNKFVLVFYVKREGSPFCFMFFLFFFQGHADAPHSREPINFVVLHFFDVLPSRHLRRLSLNPCYTSSLLFLLPLDPPSHDGAALACPNKR